MNLSIDNAGLTIPILPVPPDPNSRGGASTSENFPPLQERAMEIDTTPKQSQLESYVGALGYKVGSRTWLKVRLPPRAYEVIEGKTMVVFTKEEHELLADTCRWTIIGKFLRGIPTIDQIRVDFALLLVTKGEIKIGAKDKYHVFIDVENEDNFNNFYSRENPSL